MTNWKTTISGLLAALGASMLQSTDPTIHMIGTVMSPLATILLGMFAADSKPK